MNKTIELPCYGMKLEISNGGGTITSDLKEQCPCCGSAECCLDCDESQADDAPEDEDEARSRIDFNRAVDGIEALVLATACEGIDVTTPAFLAAIETAVEAASHNT